MCVGRGSRRHRHWPFIATTCTPARSRSLFCPLPACSAQLRLLMRAIRRGTATEACGARRGNSTVEHPCNLRLGHRPGDHGWSYFALARLRVPAHPLVLVQVGMTAHPDTPRSPTPCLLFALPSVTGSGRYGSYPEASRLRGRPTASRPHLCLQIFLRVKKGRARTAPFHLRCTATLCCNLDDRFRIAAVIR